MRRTIAASHQAEAPSSSNLLSRRGLAAPAVQDSGPTKKTHNSSNASSLRCSDLVGVMEKCQARNQRSMGIGMRKTSTKTSVN